MIQQAQDDDPLLTSLLRILRHLEEEEEITLNNGGHSLFFGRNRIHSAPEMEPHEDERLVDVRNRQISPRKWYVLRRHRGKVSFNHRLDHRHGDSGIVNNSLDDWSFQSKCSGAVNNSLDDWSVQRTRVEKPLAHSGIGCASILNEAGEVNTKHYGQTVISRSNVTSRIHEKEEGNNSTHSADVVPSRRTTKLLSGPADDVSSERTVKLLSQSSDVTSDQRTAKLLSKSPKVSPGKRTTKLLSGPADDVLSERTVKLLSQSSGIASDQRTAKLLSKSAGFQRSSKLSKSQPSLASTSDSNNVVSSSINDAYDDVRRGRWRRGVFSIYDVEPAYQKCEGQTDKSNSANQAARPRRSLTRQRTVHMVNLSETSSVEGLSSASEVPSPSVDSDLNSRSITNTEKMNVKVITSRRRSPSPKQRHAPDPPCRSSASVIHCNRSSSSCEMAGKPKQVSTADLASPDHQGWAMDQLHGTRVWCVLADMLFCTFESEVASESREIIMLPGCKVRSLVFKSAKRDGLAENADKANEYRKKTISGVDRYQFLIDNVTSRRKYLFGIETKSDLDKWVELLTQASSVDNSHADQSQHLESPRDRADNSVTPTGSPYLPTNHRCRRMDIMSMSLGDGKLRESQKRDTIVDFKKRLRRDPDIELKSHPLRATHNPDSPKQTIIHATDSPKERANMHTSDSSKDITSKPKSKSFLKLKSFGSLDSLLRRKKHSRKTDEDDDDDSEQDFEDESMTFRSARNRSQSMNGRSDSGNNLHPRSWGLSKSSEALSPSTKRSVSDLKDKIFNAKCSPRSIGLRLEDLTDVRICGSLMYKFMAKWIKLWCVVSRGCLYGFKSQDADQSPVVAVVLTQCSVTYVTDPEKRNSQMYVFKLSQPHSKSIYMCAQEEGELSKWLQVLQMEASHVLADDNTHMDTSDLNHSVDSAFSTMSLSSSQTDVTDTGQRSPLDQTIVGEHHLEHAERSSSGTDNSNEFTPEYWYSGGTVSSQMDTPLFDMGLDSAPKHDPNLTRVWQKDKGYLFQVIRAKLRQKKRNSSSATSRDQPGPEAGGLLVLHDDDDDDDDVVFETVNGSSSSALRRAQSVGGDVFSSSDGIGDGVTSPHKEATHDRPMSARSHGAQELQTPAMNGFLERRSFNGQWTRYWYVIKDGCLYCYLSPEDKVTVDVTELDGYLVQTLVDEFRGKRFVIHLNHEDYVPVHLSVESRDEMDEWAHALVDATELANQKQENKFNNGNSESRRQQTVKQKLLAEVLRQKTELEKKQAARLQIKSADPVYIAQETPNGEEHISTMTRLKQRRLSTQIKMSTLQKQMDNKNGTKKSLFHFGKKKPQTSQNPHLTEQLKELSQRLQEIDTNLSDQGASVVDVGNKSHSDFRSRVTTDIILNKSVESEDSSVSKDLPVRRSNSLKSSVQRFAHRTFAKASWKKSRKTNSLQSDAHPDDLDHSSEHCEDSPDYIDLRCTTPDKQIQVSEDRLSFNSSSTDIYNPKDRPVVDRADGSSSIAHGAGISRSILADDTRSVPQSPGSPREGSSSLSTSLSLSDGGPMMNGFTDGSSVGSDTDMTSPRREVNPLVMAQIEEFEDFSRQMLEQRTSFA